MRNLHWRSLLGADHTVMRWARYRRPLCELAWQVNGNVGSDSGQSSGVQRSPPCESLHIGHWRTVIDRRSMLLCFCSTVKTRRGQVTGRRYSRGGRLDPVAINITSLFCDAETMTTDPWSRLHPSTGIAFLQQIDGVSIGTDALAPKKALIGERRPLWRPSRNTQPQANQTHCSFHEDI